MHTIRVVAVALHGNTLVAVPYVGLTVKLSRHAALHYLRSSLHLHVCNCMDAGIDRCRRLHVFMPCPQTAHKNRHWEAYCREVVKAKYCYLICTSQLWDSNQHSACFTSSLYLPTPDSIPTLEVHIRSVRKPDNHPSRATYPIHRLHYFYR